mgnify:CR=1 FL=1
MKDIKLLKSSFLNSYLSVMEYLMFISNSSDDYRIIVTKDTLNNYLDGINIIIEKNYFKGENNSICYKNGIVLASDDASELIDAIRNDFKDKKLNYKELVMQAEKTYFVLQKAWTKNEINLAKDYLTKELYENYKSKLQWM